LEIVVVPPSFETLGKQKGMNRRTKSPGVLLLMMLASSWNGYIPSSRNVFLMAMVRLKFDRVVLSGGLSKMSHSQRRWPTRSLVC
jgi:hypothetical protein